MTAYTKLQIIQIGTDVHIRVWGTRGKHLSDALLTAIEMSPQYLNRVGNTDFQNLP